MDSLNPTKKHQEQYNLTWHNYSDHLTEMMREMLYFGNHTDVTLISDDSKPIQAHRNILSACSPVFNDILQMDKQNNHSLIYLRGIQYEELESVLQFMYLGQATFYEERANEFLMVAKSLQIKNLNLNFEDHIDHSNNATNHSPDVKENKPVHETIEVNTIVSTILPSSRSQHQCPQCEKLLSNRAHLKRHILSVHEGIKT